MSATATSISLPKPAQPTAVSVPVLAQWLIFLVLAVGCFSGPLDVAEGTGGENAARVAKVPSLLMKLANAGAAAAIGVWGIFCLPLARRYLTSPPGLILCMVASIFALTCVTSIKPSASIPICLVFVAYLLFMPTALAVLGLRGTMASGLLGCAMFSLGSIFLYFLVPRIGVFVEEFNDGVTIERMGGMSQPNHVGRSAMIGLLLTAYFMRVYRKFEVRMLLSGLVCIFAVVGVLSMSRTALLGIVICLVILNLDLVFTKLGLTASWLMLVGGMAALVLLLAIGKEDALAKKILGAVTKTGDLQEVTQVTGRYDIWERAVKLIKGRPLQGYGLGSNKEMLKDHLQSTHNVLLHPTLAAGVFAGGLTLLLLLWNLSNVFTYHNLLIRALSAYVIISGLTEDTLYETFPGACTLLWMVCCLWPAVEPD